MQKKIIFGILMLSGLIIAIALIGVYKFDYLSSKDKYNVDGNKIENIEKSEIEKSGSAKLLSPVEFREKVDSGEYVVVDIRTPEEFHDGHIKGAINIDFYSPDFKDKVSKLDKNKKYLYYCRSGHRSGESSSLVQEFEFKYAYELKGGINAWKESGYEIE